MKEHIKELSGMYYKHCYTDEKKQNPYIEGSKLHKDLIFLTELISRMKKSRFQLMIKPCYLYRHNDDILGRIESYIIDNLIREESYCTSLIMFIDLGRTLIQGDRDYNLIHEFDGIIKKLFDITVLDIYGNFIHTSWECELFNKEYNNYLIDMKNPKVEGIPIDMVKDKWIQIGGDVSFADHGLVIGKYNEDLKEIEVYSFSPFSDGTGNWLVHNANYDLINYKDKTLKDFGLDSRYSKLTWSLIVGCLIQDGEMSEELEFEDNGKLNPIFPSFDKAYKFVMGNEDFEAWKNN